MLKKIIMDNFTTFVQPTEIDFTATNYKFLEEENIGTNKILKGALFVGENASGKTQILKSIKMLLDLLFMNNDIDFSLYKSFYTNKETYSITYEFVINNETIVYQLELSSNKIINEKLIIGNDVLIDRLGNTAKFNYDGEKIYDDLSDKLLFLRRIYFDTHFYDNELLNQWFKFLKSSVFINCYERKIITYNSKELHIHEFLSNNGVDLINNFLKKINYAQEIDYKKTSVNDKENFVSFKKDGTKVFISEILESTGNKTLIEILPSFLHSVSNECMLIVDEFSSGFHNELEECLIKYFYHYSKNSQLFFNSHSTNILNNTLIRPDQVYSVTFNGSNGSVIKRFSDEMPREAQNTEKMYLNGVFGGMPKYNKFFKD